MTENEAVNIDNIGDHIQVDELLVVVVLLKVVCLVVVLWLRRLAIGQPGTRSRRRQFTCCDLLPYRLSI